MLRWAARGVAMGHAAEAVRAAADEVTGTHRATTAPSRSCAACSPDGRGASVTGDLAWAVPAPLLFVVSGLTQYLGAALAVGIFGTIAAASVAWLRIAVAAVVLVVWQRPWRSRLAPAGPAHRGPVRCRCWR